jgi:hypothetical protein
MKNSYSDIVANAKQFARQAIHETWPTAKEVAEPTACMYEFDAICIDDESCPISSASIMHDPEAGMFALVENARPVTPPKEETAHAPAFHLDGPIDWDKLAEDHAIAYLRGDLATSSPESYTLDEMRKISEAMDASTAKVEEAMRRDFQSWAPQEQIKMLDLLQQADPDHFYWWMETLMGQLPASPPTCCNDRQTN